MKAFFVVLLAVTVISVPTQLVAQVPYGRLVNARSEPGSWLTYSGDYQGHAYSALDQINTKNIQDLRVAWMYQTGLAHHFETMPLVSTG